MTEFAVVQLKQEQTREASVVYSRGTREAYGRAQANGAVTQDIRYTRNPVDVWWAHTFEDASGIANQLAHDNPDKQFVVLESKCIHQVVIEKTAHFVSKLTPEGLIPERVVN